eukprot:COSAG01_NODE_1023_length_12063_cov_25.977432_12_plen_49_part_00
MIWCAEHVNRFGAVQDSPQEVCMHVLRRVIEERAAIYVRDRCGTRWLL